MLTVAITIKGAPELLDKVNRFRSAIMDFTDAMKTIGHELGDGDAGYFPGQVFASQGGVLGITWPKNKTATLRYKSKHYGATATATLIRTGEMRRSFKFDANKDSVYITNTADYFKYHQSSAPRHKMPYRPMMAINKDVENIVKKVLEADIKKKVDSFNHG